MRGVLLMCILALCAALSMHYARVSGQSRFSENYRSDPLIQMQDAYRVAYDEDVDPEPPTAPKPFCGMTASLIDPDE